MKPGKIKDALIILKSVIKHWLLIYGKKHNSLVDFNDYDIVHFHSTLDMYNVRDSLKKFDGKVILTSHSPELKSKEAYENRSDFEKKYLKFIYNKLIRMDEYAFERADYFVFPCEEAEEPYYHTWDKFERIKEKKRDKFRYIPTGIVGSKPKVSREKIRNIYGIPQDAFLICYVGRHSEIKGYDILKEMAMNLLENENIYFIIAGAEKPISGLEHERWIEVGWTDDPHSIISSSDVFILPNRETYFDLIMLEVLSLGKIVVASRTGGNKYFERLNSKGVFLYDTPLEATNILCDIYEMNPEDRHEFEKQNFELFENNFTCEIFAENYKSLYAKIASE
jgi:glycosyltransferase involved in cell wall biosynthesis